MTTQTLQPTSRLAGIWSVIRLHFNKRKITLIHPFSILGLVIAVTIIITLVLSRVGIDTSTLEYAQGARGNQGVIWSIGGFFGYLGVASVATTFHFALALGATRSNFALGTLASHVLLAAYTSVVTVVLLLLEKATGQWFVNAYVFDSIFLGSGNVKTAAVVMFLATLTIFSLGGVFAASWVRFGSRGPLLLAGGAVLVIVLFLLGFAPKLADIFAGFQAWWLAVIAGVLIALSVLGEYLLLRKASVR